MSGERVATPMGSIVGRTLRRQWWVVLLLGAVGAGLGVAPHLSDAPSWASSARVSVSDQAPRSAQEAAALVASVRAVATSTSVVAASLSAAHVTRDPVLTAQNNVDVVGLGTSPIATLSVTDNDPVAARRIAQALTDEVVAAFTSQQTSGLLQLTKDLDTRIQQTQSARARLVASLGALPTSKQRADLAELDAELNDLRTQRAAAARQLAGASQAHVVDPAGAAVEQPSPKIADGVLGFVIGALIGLALVAIRELIRPSIRGADELATRFDVPVLGHLADEKADVVGLAHLRQVAAQVTLAAGRQGIERVVVVGRPDEELVSEISVALTQLVSVATRQNGRPTTVTLPSGSSGGRAVVSALPAKGSSGKASVTRVPRPATATKDVPAPAEATAPEPRVLSLGLLDDFETPLLIASQRAVGILVMTPQRIRMSALRPIDDLVSATGWPVIGVLTYVPGASLKDER